ncbi:serine hydrolase domain-containing protein [Caballeronia sp. M23-90]
MSPKKITSVFAATGADTAFFVTGKAVARPWGAATGWADQGLAEPLTCDTPFRIASNTKTLVAATVYRLWEQKRIELDATIHSLCTPLLNALLTTRGYDTESITVFHLLNHSAGLCDHADDDYIKTVLANPGHRWTREDQVRLAVTRPPPKGKAGAQYLYSDTGYILLGDIIERLAGEPLAHVVRREMRFDHLGMDSTWWEMVEARPLKANRAARQFLDGIDVTQINATMDLYGGGGLMMSARDLATFMQNLFEGRIFESPRTLCEMLRVGPHEGSEGYRGGVSAGAIDGHKVFSHLGFWGTAVYYAPDPGISVAGFTTDRMFRPALVQAIEKVLRASLGTQKL